MTRGSLKLLALTALVGIGIGALGALLRPAKAPAVSEGNLLFRGEAKALTLSDDELQRRLLERLVRHAARGDDIAQRPDFLTFQRVFTESQDKRGWILERLKADDCPPRLRLAFAAALPSRPKEARLQAFVALVVPLLDTPDDQLALAAALALDRANLLEAKTSPSCRCRFARARLPADAETSWWLAWSLHPAAGLSWSPEALPSEARGWSLGLQATQDAASNKILVMRVAAPLKPGQSLAVDGLPGPHLVVRGAH